MIKYLASDPETENLGSYMKEEYDMAQPLSDLLNHRRNGGAHAPTRDRKPNLRLIIGGRNDLSPHPARGIVSKTTVETLRACRLIVDLDNPPTRDELLTVLRARVTVYALDQEQLDELKWLIKIIAELS